MDQDRASLSSTGWRSHPLTCPHKNTSWLKPAMDRVCLCLVRDKQGHLTFLFNVGHVNWVSHKGLGLDSKIPWPWRLSCMNGQVSFPPLMWRTRIWVRTALRTSPSLFTNQADMAHLSGHLKKWQVERVGWTWVHMLNCVLFCFDLTWTCRLISCYVPSLLETFHIAQACHHPPASASWVLPFQVCPTMLSSYTDFLKDFLS